MKHPVFDNPRIFAPGPTPVPNKVLSAMSLGVMHHRTKEFIEILARVKEGLKFVFQTNQPCYLLSSSGTGAMETVVVNCLASGDEVLVVNAGKFGERWEKISSRYGLKPTTLKVEWGNPVTPDEIKNALKANSKLRAVLIQASETSTGVYHPIQEIAKVVKENSDALFIVDAITALGVADLPMDKWGVDAVVSGSQKAFMLPPGLAFLALSERAQEARKRANIPSFYFNLAAEDKAAAGGETAWTPAVSLICGLDLVLTEMKRSGLEKIFKHHEKLAAATRLGAQAMGLELFAKSSPSSALTSIHVPAGIPEGKKIISHLRDEYGITVAGGQDAWKGKMFRLAHLGYFDELDMLTILGAVEITLKKLGHNLELGKGVGRASQYFLEGK